MTCWDYDGGCMNLPIICSYLYDSSCCCHLGLLHLASSLHIPLNCWARFSLFVFGAQQYQGIVTSY
ncbi:hypothetical protein BDZ91DRAFT_720434 [Kalaharituber pfeilii]|nr:hypothetical protein BDZ91DRAFT_720434 [Kalaharituber pfeilii]